jgi:hypothetical protein
VLFWLQKTKVGVILASWFSLVVFWHVWFSLVVFWLFSLSSTSLKHLSITGCIFCHDSHRRLHVSAPSLASLKLDDLIGIAPIFENMLLLEMACVSLGNQGADFCCNDFMSGILCRADNACPTCADYPADYVLLAAISSARHRSGADI